MKSTNDPITLSDDSLKQIQVENELMKVRLQTEMGAVVYITGSPSPQMEHAFLKMILAIEGVTAVKYVSIHELIGKPVLPTLTGDLTEAFCEKEVLRLLDELDKFRIDVVFREDLSWREMLRFLVIDLMPEEVDDYIVPTIRSLFFYESFYPSPDPRS